MKLIMERKSMSKSLKVKMENSKLREVTRRIINSLVLKNIRVSKLLMMRRPRR
jgi:hypothetical protein